MPVHHRVAILLPNFDSGGVERYILNLARGWTDRGISVDLLTRRITASLHEADDYLRIFELPEHSPRRQLHRVSTYLHTEPPAALLASKEQDYPLVLRAARGTHTPTYLRVATHLSQMLRHRSWYKRWKTMGQLRRSFREATGIIAISQGVADDVRTIAGSHAAPVTVAPNPTVTPELLKQAQAPAEHPWLAGGGPPVIVAVGRFSRAKDFPTLIRAFAELRQHRPARLLILGEGRQRQRLEQLIQELNITQDVDMPGFEVNPARYLVRSQLFVLSSLWEGLSNILIEALALGTPVVATDCLSGPREILQGGRYGPLVPIQQPLALAEAMANTLDDPLPAETLKEAAFPFSRARSALVYAQILGLEA